MAMSKQVATLPQSIEYLTELKRHGWEDPFLCLPEDRVVVDLGGLSDEFAELAGGAA